MKQWLKHYSSTLDFLHALTEECHHPRGEWDTHQSLEGADDVRLHYGTDTLQEEEDTVVSSHHL